VGPELKGSDGDATLGRQTPCLGQRDILSKLSQFALRAFLQLRCS
jgi:hypothetical protein